MFWGPVRKRKEKKRKEIIYGVNPTNIPIPFPYAFFSSV